MIIPGTLNVAGVTWESLLARIDELEKKVEELQGPADAGGLVDGDGTVLPTDGGLVGGDGAVLPTD